MSIIIHRVKARNVIGERVKTARLSSKPRVTQNELAARLQTMGIDIDRPMLSKIENGVRPIYDYEVLALSQALKIPVSQLYGEKSGRAKPG
jgi:transcriptional regulator with XRE-family HTH domain